MEKKNYLKCMTAIMLLLASFSMASCESVIDAIFGEVDNPTGQVVQTVVSVTGATPEEVSAALKAVITDEAVQKSIANGEPIKITIASANGINSEAADQTNGSCRRDTRIRSRDRKQHMAVWKADPHAYCHRDQPRR